MAMHLEFVVLGPPISNQQSTKQGRTNLATWQATVAAEARKKWANPTMHGMLKAIIINFHIGDKPPVDLDNMSKPILDVLEEIVYDNDRQIRQAELTHIRIDAPFVVVAASKILVLEMLAGNEFVYVRIEDPVHPFPLPK